MGVIRDGCNPFLIRENDDLENFMPEPVNVPSSIPPQILPSNYNARSKHNKHKASPVKPMDTSRIDVPKSQGKKLRRYVNALELKNLDSTEDQDEVSIYDFRAPSLSPFGKLLGVNGEIQEWSNFLNCSEEDQNEMLLSMKADSLPSKKDVKCNGCEDYKMLTPKECYLKISSKCRTLLKRKNFPLGIVSCLENEIVDFFKQFPQSVFSSFLQSSFDRLLLHTLCQYLDLDSYSVNHQGRRETKVENRHLEFKLPTVMLTEYLTMMKIGI